MKQHYVPRFYLANFAERHVRGKNKKKSYVWVVDLERRSKQLNEVGNVATVKNLYTQNLETPGVSDESFFQLFREVTGEDFFLASPERNHDNKHVARLLENPEVIEKFYSEIENRAAPIVKNIVGGDTRIVQGDERNVLAWFIACQITRTLSYHKFAETQVMDELLSGAFGKILGAPTGKRIVDELMQAEVGNGRVLLGDEDLAYLLDGAIASSDDLQRRSLVVAFSFSKGMEFLGGVWSLQWVLCFANAKAGLFLTTDNPVWVWKDFEEVLFPISKNAVFYLQQRDEFKGEESREIIAAAAVERINRYLLENANKFVFCPTEELADWALETVADWRKTSD